MYSVLELCHPWSIGGIICLRTEDLFKVIPWEVDLK
jgi:hypothetical protein